jgi:hypothetical protein
MPRNRVGHQGLFYDRLTGTVLDQQIGRGFAGVYYNRNRTYSPGLGRFLQRDPNGSSSPIISGPSHNGQCLAAWAGSFDLSELAGDGLNLYQCEGSSPSKRSDAVGLEWQDDYEGVILPLVQVLDAILPRSMLDPLNALLDGYHELYYLKNRVNREIQQPMYDREDEADWAVDWGRADDEYGPRRASNSIFNDVETPFGPLAGMYPAKAAANGRAVEREARNTGVMRIGRRTESGHLETSTRVGNRWRFHDGVDPKNPKLMIETKVGSQGPSKRILAQMDKDAAIIAEREKDVKWVLYEHEGRPVHPQLVQELKNRNIKYELRKMPR